MEVQRPAEGETKSLTHPRSRRRGAPSRRKETGEPTTEWREPDGPSTTRRESRNKPEAYCLCGRLKIVLKDGSPSWTEKSGSCRKVKSLSGD